MEKKVTQYLKVLLSFMLVISISGGIILGTQLLYKINHKTKEDIMAEKNKVVLGDESIFYVDLTKKPEDYEKISKVEEEKNISTENTMQNENNSQTIQENSEVQNVVNQINQNYYDINVDMETGTITADGEKININKMLKDNEKKEELYNYLKDNVVGDVEYQDGKIKIENPYSTKTVMMQTDNLTELNDCGNVESIVRVSDDVYCVHYKDAKSTKDGYNLLKNNELVEKVAKDTKVSVLENEDTEEVSANKIGDKVKAQATEIEAQVISGNNYAWGIQSTGIIQYVNKLNYAKNNNDIKVAVLDTGVRTTHEVFKNQSYGDRLDLTNAYNYVGNSTDISDDNGHGTMVAGIIAESTSNNVKIVPVKILGNDGKGNYSSALQAASAIASKVDVLNVSLGADESKITAEAKAIGESILKPIYEAGKTVVCAAGNDGAESVYYPASSQYTIAVSAVDSQNQIASFSNYGNSIDFTAPGKGLILPYYTGDNLYNSSFSEDSAEYSKNSGTSFASPFIAADFAMLKSENPKYSITDMKNILIENCEDLGDSGKDKYYGYGNVNFDTKMFAKPVIANVSLSIDEEQNNKIEIYAVGGNTIKSWTYTTTDTEPTDDSNWRTFSSSAKAVHITLTSTKTTEDRKYYIWIKDEKNNVVKQEVTVKGTNENTNTGNTNSNTTTNTGNTNSNATTNTNAGNTNSNTTTNTNAGNTNSNTTTNTNTENTNSNAITNTNTGNTDSNTTENTNTENTSNNVTNNTNTENINTTTNTNNSAIGGGVTNSINNNISNDSIKVSQDNSKASKILPKTGQDKILSIAVIIILLAGMFTFVKYKKMKDVK